MKKYVINIKDLSKLYIYTDMNKVCNKLSVSRNMSKTIPATIECLGDVENIVENENYIVLLKSNTNYIEIDKERNISTLFALEDSFFFPDLVYLALCMFSNDLQKKRLYFIQGSVVKYDSNHSIMLVGDPNSGKTSMAYSLMKEYGYKLISNDNVLVDSNKTVCGTKDMQMRLGSIKSIFQEILPFIKIDRDDENRNDWDIKVYITDYLIKNGFDISADESTITDIYNLSTYNNGGTFIKQREPIDELLLIYEQLTKQIRSNRYAIVSMNYPLPSFENEYYMKQRYDIALQMSNSINIYDAKGSIKTLTRKIGEKYEK